MSGITDHPDDFDRECLPQGLRAWRRSGRGGARSNKAQSGNAACL
jgi:hypothetical protein